MTTVSVDSARMGVLMGVLLGLSASGCLLESHPPRDPLSYDRFCDEFFDALCEPIEDCGCVPEAVQACRTEQRGLCSGYPSPALVAAVEEGRLLYDGAAADALLTRMHERAASCEGFVSALDWRVRDLFDLGGVFRGTLAPGHACAVVGFELISECELGSCASTADGHVCRGSVGVGAACDRTHQCVALDAELTIERGIGRLALRCVTEGAGDAGVCADWIDEGGACGVDADCWSSRCEDLRCRAVALGGACLSSRDCASDYCASLDRTCQPGDAPLGAPCDDASACASHVCIAEVCAPAGCGTF